MNLKEILEEDFGVDLPISGGKGSSKEDPIVINKHEKNDCSSIEYTILNYINLGRGVNWKIVQQEKFIYEERHLEKIRIETVTIGKELSSQFESYYFDITECVPLNQKSKSSRYDSFVNPDQKKSQDVKKFKQNKFNLFLNEKILKEGLVMHMKSRVNIVFCYARLTNNRFVLCKKGFFFPIFVLGVILTSFLGVFIGVTAASYLVMIFLICNFIVTKGNKVFLSIPISDFEVKKQINGSSVGCLVKTKSGDKYIIQFDKK